MLIQSEKSLKKSLSILLSLLILVSSGGFAISIDYCPFQKKTSISITGKSSCCGGNMPMPRGCCSQTKIIVEKIKDNYTPSAYSTISPLQFSLLALIYTKPFLFSFHSSQTEHFFLSDSSPPDIPVSLNILYRSILI